MPLSKLLPTGNYDPEQIVVMQTALDGACRELEILNAANGKSYSIDREAVARVIIALFESATKEDTESLKHRAVDAIVRRKA